VATAANCSNYDTGGRLTSVTTPSGASGEKTTYAYTSGRLTSIQDPDGNLAARNTYNASGQVTSQQDAAGNLTSFSYTTTSGGLPETDVTSPDGGITTAVFGGGALLETVAPLTGTTSYVLGGFPEPVTRAAGRYSDQAARATSPAYSQPNRGFRGLPYCLLRRRLGSGMGEEDEISSAVLLRELREGIGLLAMPAADQERWLEESRFPVDELALQLEDSVLACFPRLVDRGGPQRCGQGGSNCGRRSPGHVLRPRERPPWTREALTAEPVWARVRELAQKALERIDASPGIPGGAS
jgi:YD repeat-containing protein